MPATATEPGKVGTQEPDLDAITKTYEGLFNGPQSFDATLTPEVRAKLSPILSTSVDPDSQRKRWANTTFLSHMYRRPWNEVNRALDMYRDDYAKQVHGLTQQVDDAAFYSLQNGVLQDAKREREMLAQMHAGLFQAFGAGKDFNSTFEAQRQTLSKGPGWKSAKLDAYRQWARSVWDEDTRFSEMFSEQIETVASYMKMSRNRDMTGDNGAKRFQEMREDALGVLRGMTPQDRMRALDLAASGVTATPGGEESTAGKAIGRIARGSVNLVEGALSSALDLGMQSYGLGPIPDVEREIARQLDRRIQGEVDPLKGEGWVSNGLLNAAQGVPSLLASLNPVGVAVVGLSIRNEVQGGLLERGIPYAEASNLASVIAVPEAALQLLSARMVIGKVPGLSSMVTPIFGEGQLTAGALSARFLKNLGVEAAGFAAIGEAQQLTPLAVQATASVLDKSIPGVGFSEFLEASKQPFTPEALVAIAPMILIGSGVATFRERSHGQAYVRHQRNLDAIGFTEEQQNRILAATTPEQSYAEMQKAWHERQLGTPKQAEAVQALNEESQQIQPTDGPQIERKADGVGFIVKDATGTPVGEATTPETAGKLIQEVKAATRPQPPKMNEATPERDDSPVPDGDTALNKAAIKELRAYFPWLKELPDPTVERWASVLAAVKSKGAHSKADEIAADILSNPRMVSAEEHVAMVVRSAELQNEYDALMERAAKASEAGDLPETARLRGLAENALNSLDRLTEASDLTGTQIGRALSIRRVRLTRDTFQLAQIIQRAKISRGGALTPEQTRAFEALSVQLKEANARIDKLTSDLAKQRDAATKTDAETFVNEGKARRRGVDRELLQKRRARYKKELAALGYRVNDITNSIGLSVEAATIVSKLAETHIEEGVLNLQELVTKLKAQVPDLSEQDIYNAVGRRIGKGKRAIQTEVQARITELRKQAKLLTQINDAVSGKIEAPKTKAQASETVAALREQLAQLKMQAMRTTMDDAQLQRIAAKIDEVQAQLSGGFRKVPEAGKETSEPDTITAARLKLVELQRLMRTTDAISDLEEQLRTGDYKVSAKEERVIMNADLESALVRRKQLQREVNQRIEDLRPKTITDRAIEAVDFLRAAKATADMSAALRQALILGARRPGRWGKAFVGAARAAFDQNTADAIELAILNHPNQVERAKAGLYISTRDVAVSAREESFRSNLIEKIPGLGAIARASERHMTTMVNLLRASSFDQFLAAHPESTPQQRQAFAAYVNAASGRGDLGRFTQAAGKLSLVFFSPRFAVSRFQVLYSPFKNIRDPVVRNEIVKDMLAFGGTGLAVLGLAALAGAEVSLDPTDSDFGKIQTGDTRIDIWAGNQQVMRLVLQPVLAAADKTGVADLQKDVDPLDSGLRFLSYKLSPTVTVPLELVRGKNMVGEKRGMAETLIRAITPLTIEAVVDVAKNSGPEKAVMAGGLNFFGVGVNEQPPREKTKK